MSQKETLGLSKEVLEKVLQRKLERKISVLSVISKPATQKGENYGSTLLSLVITLGDEKGKTEATLHVLAKLAPPTEFLQSVFNFPFSFIKEMSIYKLVNPAFLQIQEEYNIGKENLLDIVPSFYGACTSADSDEDEKASSSAFLLLENLKVKGYKMAERLKCLNLKHCELVMSKLGEFHALPIALKQKKPDIYKKTVLKAARYYENPLLNSAEESHAEMFYKTFESHNPELSFYFEKMRKLIIKNEKEQVPLYKEPFATIVHNDFWTNNMLFLYRDNDPKFPVDVKFIDFQGTMICSPVRDVIFFLFTSAEESVLAKHFDYLMNLYFSSFVKKLQDLQCNTDMFSKEDFEKEIDEFAPTQFFHILFMLTIINAQEDHVTELNEVNNFDHINSPTAWNSQCKDKVYRTAMVFNERGWL